MSAPRRTVERGIEKKTIRTSLTGIRGNNQPLKNQGKIDQLMKMMQKPNNKKNFTNGSKGNKLKRVLHLKLDKQQIQKVNGGVMQKLNVAKNAIEQLEKEKSQIL